MPSTHLSLHYHIVFSTKGRRRVIANTWRDNLHTYIGGIIGDMNAVPSAIGAPGNHAHVLVGLRATHVLADVVRQMKRGSSECTPPACAGLPGSRPAFRVRVQDAPGMRRRAQPNFLGPFRHAAVL
jgi:REP element-mobilizing transposase RayT